MKPLFFIAVFLLSTLTVFAQRPTLTAGESFITLNGERFKNETIPLSSGKVGVGNLWFDDGTTKYTDIKLLGNYKGRSMEFQLHVTGQKGSYKIENNRNETGSQKDDFNCYFILSDGDTYGDGVMGQPGSLTVNFTRYDAVGGLIEGELGGQLMAGARNDIPIAVTGKFSVVRTRDRKSF